MKRILALLTTRLLAPLTALRAQEQTPSHPVPIPRPGPTRPGPLKSNFLSDGGKTWPVRKLIEGDPDGWYCYTAIHFVGDTVLLGHCAGDSKVGAYLATLRIRRISLDWLRQP